MKPATDNGEAWSKLCCTYARNGEYDNQLIWGEGFNRQSIGWKVADWRYTYHASEGSR